MLITLEFYFSFLITRHILKDAPAAASSSPHQFKQNEKKKIKLTLFLWGGRGKASLENILVKEASVTSKNVIAAPWGEPVWAQRAGKCSVLEFGGQNVGAAGWGGWDRAGSEQLTSLSPENLGNPSVERRRRVFFFAQIIFMGMGQFLHEIHKSFFTQIPNNFYLKSQSPNLVPAPAKPALPKPWKGKNLVPAVLKFIKHIKAHLWPTHFCHRSGNHQPPPEKEHWWVCCNSLSILTAPREGEKILQGWKIRRKNTSMDWFFSLSQNMVMLKHCGLNGSLHQWVNGSFQVLLRIWSVIMKVVRQRGQSLSPPPPQRAELRLGWAWVPRTSL